MRYLYNSVKARKDATITVSISRPTKVMIMSGRQFTNYQNNHTFTYFGGEKNGSYVFKSPKDAEWYVVVEKGTGANPPDVQVSIRVDMAEKPAPRVAAPAPEPTPEPEPVAEIEDSGDEDSEEE